jgi:uncharacterized protein
MADTLKNLFFVMLGIVMASAFFLGQSGIIYQKATSDGASGGLIRLSEEAEPVQTIPIVAVNQYDSTGIIGNLSLRTIPGQGNVLIEISPYIQPDLQYSASTAVDVARDYVGIESDKDFVLEFQTVGGIVGGGSAGAAITMASIAALEGKTLSPDVIMTGSILPDGSIGEVGGLVEKGEAAADAGYKMFLVPKGQSKVTYFERIIEESPTRTRYGFYTVRHVKRSIDLQEALGDRIDVREVANIREAVKYFF